jgi:hypothetical protein
VVFISKEKEKTGNKIKKTKGHYSFEGIGGVIAYPSLFGFGLEELDGGGGSVRRRNTLHVVGGRQFLSQARFTGREKKDENN